MTNSWECQASCCYTLSADYSNTTPVLACHVNNSIPATLFVAQFVRGVFCMTCDGSFVRRHATMSRLASFVFTQGEKSAAKTRVVRALSRSCTVHPLLTSLCRTLVFCFIQNWFSRGVLVRIMQGGWTVFIQLFNFSIQAVNSASLENHVLLHASWCSCFHCTVTFHCSFL